MNFEGLIFSAFLFQLVQTLQDFRRLGFQPVAKLLIIGLGDFVRAEVELQFFNGDQRFFFTYQKMLILITGRVYGFHQLFEFQLPKKRDSYCQQDRNDQNQF